MGILTEDGFGESFFDNPDLTVTSGMNIILIANKAHSTGEVGALLRVDQRTVNRWCTAGKLGDEAWRTDGGHWRIEPGKVRELLTREGHHAMVGLP